MASLDTLPKELLSHIAVNSDALSILHLSQTCRAIRAACYDSVVFRELLNNKSSLWGNRLLDTELVGARCGRDANLWARYALADQKAWELAQKDNPLETPADFLNWLPELLAVKHPFMYQSCWSRFLVDSDEVTPKRLFCFAMAILAQPEEPMQQLEESLGMMEDQYMRFDETSKGYFWGLCFTIFRFRGYMRSRPQSNPNVSPAIRYIPLPTATEIDMRPANATYQLPLPFGNRGAGALNWDDWYVTHSREMAKDGLFDGEWRGYYTYYRTWIPSLDRLDPPMLRIRFVRRQSSNGEPTAALEVAADDCIDGLGPFTVEGNISQVDDVFSFQGNKVYGEGNIAGGDVNWHWKLKVTPLGMTGYWGMLQDNGELFRHGSVWLWRVSA